MIEFLIFAAICVGIWLLISRSGKGGGTKSHDFERRYDGPEQAHSLGGVSFRRTVQKRSSKPASDMPDNRAAFHGALDLVYIDAGNTKSERYVEANSLQAKNGRLYLWGWCEKRQAVRQFRVDRIIELTDGETGEIIEQGDITRWLKQRAGIETGE